MTTTPAKTETTATEAESLARSFAATYDTPHVRQAIAYAESGRLTWEQIAALFARSYGIARATATV